MEFSKFLTQSEYHTLTIILKEIIENSYKDQDGFTILPLEYPIDSYGMELFTKAYIKIMNDMKMNQRDPIDLKPEE